MPSSPVPNPAVAPWANKLFALLSSSFVVTTTTSSNDSSPSEGTEASTTLSNDSSPSEGTGTSTSEGANPPLTSIHEVKLPSLANIWPQIAEIHGWLRKLFGLSMRENRFSLSNLFPNEPYPEKYSMRIQILSPKSLNEFGFFARREHQYIIYNIQLKVGDLALRPFTTIPLGHLHYDNNMTTWIVVLDRLGNLFALRSEEIDDEELEYSDPERPGALFEAEVVEAPAFGESLLAVYLGPLKILQDDDNTTTSTSASASSSSLSLPIPLDKVTSWDSFEPSRKIMLDPAVVICHDLASILRDTSSNTSIL